MKLLRKNAIALCVCLTLPFALHAQLKLDPEALAYVQHSNYGQAMPLIAKQLESAPDHPLLNYYAGLCYLHSRSQKHRAVQHLEKAVEHSQWWRNGAAPRSEEAPADVHKLLGDAYTYAYKFDAAVQAYEKYTSLRGKDKNTPPDQEAAIKTDICRHLKDFKPGVSLPLSAKTGSPCADLLYGTMTGSLSGDQRTMIYTLKVPVNKITQQNETSRYFETMPLPPLKDSASKKRQAHAARKHVERDTVVYATTIGTSHDGQVMLTYKNDEGDGNLYISRLRDNRWSKPVKMKKCANRGGWELYESLSADGKHLYFASDQPGGYGGMDLYRCKMQPDGTWSKAENLGPGINTDADEIAPFIHTDGTTLFFSSNRNRPGSFDILSSTAAVGSGWTKPQNVGFPINRNDSDIFQVTADNKRIYERAPKKADSAVTGPGATIPGTARVFRPERDNYLITFSGQYGSPLNLRRGTVTDEEGEHPVSARISIYDNKTGELSGDFIADDRSGGFSVMLPAGKNLQIVYEADGFLPRSENIDLRKEQNFFSEFTAVRMAPLKPGATCTLSNVFFDQEKTNPDPESLIELDRIVKLMKDNPGIKAGIRNVIYTDVNRRFYKRLAKDRARAIGNYLTANGIQKKRLEVEGTGKKDFRDNLQKKEQKEDKSRIKKREKQEEGPLPPLQQATFTIEKINNEER